MNQTSDATARQRWEDLYRRYHRQLVRHVQGLTGDRDRSEDIAHEVFLAALVQIKAGHTRPSWPWLRSLASRLLSTEHEMGFDDVIPTGLPVARLRTVDPGSDPDELAALLPEAFGRLSSRDRLVLSLHYEEGWTKSEIARLLKVEPSSVASFLLRARRRLRAQLDDLRRGGLAVVAWLVAGRRRLAGVVARAPAPAGDEAALVWRLFDRLQPLVGVMATSAATLSLTAVVAIGGPTDPDAPRARPASPAPPVVAHAAHAAAVDVPPAEGRHPAPAERGDRAVRATVAPAVNGGRDGEMRWYEVAPAAAGSSDVEAGERRFTVGSLMGFECPPPEERRPTQAVGCPLLEDAAPLLPES